MAQISSSLKNMVLSLTIVTALSAVILSSVFIWTKTPIALAKEKASKQSFQVVFPGNDSISMPTALYLEGYTDSFYVYDVYKSHQYIGSAVKSVSKKGYGGTIKLLVGFDTEGNITDYAVLEHKETPGLGNKITDWFHSSIVGRDIRGMNPDMNNMTVVQDGGEIDAITASTISSKAFLEAVRLAYAAYEEKQSDKQ